MIKNPLFIQAHNLFLNKETSTDPLLELLLNTIHKTLETLREHQHGKDFYIQSHFNVIKDSLPSDVDITDFEAMINQCRMAEALCFSEEKVNAFPTEIRQEPQIRDILRDAKGRAKNEFWALGPELAGDIMGDGTVKMIFE